MSRLHKNFRASTLLNFVRAISGKVKRSDPRSSAFTLRKSIGRMPCTLPA